MLTCTPESGSSNSNGQAADSWQVVTLRISSAYPQEPPSVVVRMSRDANLAPQVCALKPSTMNTPLLITTMISTRTVVVKDCIASA